MSQYEVDELYSKNEDELLQVIIKGEDVLYNKVKSVEIVVGKLMSNGWEQMTLEILDCLIVSAKQLIENVFDENIEILHYNNEDFCEDSTVKLREHLQLGIVLLKVVNLLITYITSRESIALSEILRVPLTVLNIVRTTFVHCKSSKTIYNIYFESIEELIQLFRNAQEIHRKFLIVLYTNLVVNLELQDEKEVLLNVINRLYDIIEVALGINTKTVVDTWKGFLAIVKQNADALKYELNIDKPLKILSTECLKTMSEIDKTLTDENEINEFLKINKFYMKVAKHIFITYWELSKHLQKEILDFFATIYSFPDPHLYPNTLTGEVLKTISDIYYTVVEEFLLKFISEVDTLQIDEVISTTHDNCLGVFIVIIKIMENMEFYSGINRVFSLLKAVFKRLQTGTHVLQMDLKINGQHFYEYLQLTCLKICLQMDSEEYELVERLLLENTLKGNTLQSLFAIDLWTLLLRHAPPTLSIQVIEPLLEIVHSEPQIHLLSENNDQYEKLTCFVQTVCNNLPDDLREDMLDMYVSVENITIWRFIGFRNISQRRLQQIDATIEHVYKRIDRIDQGNFSLDDWLYVIDGFAIMSLMPDNLEIANKSHAEYLMKLWNVNFPSDGALNDVLFSNFLSQLCRITGKLVGEFHDDQLIHILKQLRNILLNGSPDMKVSAMHILPPIFNDEIICDESLQETVSDLLRCFLCENNPLLKEFGFEMVNNLLSTATCRRRNSENMVSAKQNLPR